MAKTMKAGVVRAFGEPLEICDVPVPTPGPGEVLVKMIASGVCHTDLHAAEGDWPVKPALPFIPGHEGAGIVVGLGAGVRDLKEGDPVGIAWLHDACGSCEFCVSGWETLCERQHNSGYSVNGSFAEYAIGSAAYVARLPARPDFAALAPILCAGVTTYKGIKETEARPGEWIVISGVGGLGHVAIQYAKAMGLHVLAVDVSDDKLVLARSVGADVVVNGMNHSAVADVLKQTGGGAQGVLVTAASTLAFGQALKMVRRKGTVSLVGLPPGHFPTPIFEVVLKRITIRGSIVGTRQDLAEALAFAADGKIRARIHRTSLECVNDVFDALKHRQVDGRVVLDLATAYAGNSSVVEGERRYQRRMSHTTSAAATPTSMKNPIRANGHSRVHKLRDIIDTATSVSGAVSSRPPPGRRRQESLPRPSATGCRWRGCRWLQHRTDHSSASCDRGSLVTPSVARRRQSPGSVRRRARPEPLSATTAARTISSRTLTLPSGLAWPVALPRTLAAPAKAAESKECPATGTTSTA